MPAKNNKQRSRQKAIKPAYQMITNVQVKTREVNTDFGKWDKQFKVAINNGAIPDGDLTKGLPNHFDKNEW